MSSAQKRTRGAGGLEFISLDGLRVDGRRPWEVRKIRSSLGPLSRADGSAYFEQGNTRVLAAVYGPREPTGVRRNEGDRGVISCEFSTALFASASRQRTWKGDRRSTAAARDIKRVFEGVVLLRNYPRSQIDIYIQILQNDGAPFVAAVNAASLALVNAGVAMKDFVVACSVGYVDNEFVLDTCAVECAADRPQLSVAVLAHTGKVVSVDLESKLPNLGVLTTAMQHCEVGCKQIFNVLEHEIRQFTLNLLDSRGLVAF